MCSRSVLKVFAKQHRDHLRDSLMMARKMPNVVLVCLCVNFTHLASPDLNYTLLIPCKQFRNYFKIPHNTESYLRIVPDPYRRWKTNIHKQCWVFARVPAGKFLSLKTRPFEPTAACRDMGIWVKVDDNIHVHPCDKRRTYYASKSEAKIAVYIGRMDPPFSIIFDITALEKYGRTNLNVSHHSNVHGVITPYLFDGVSDYAENIYAYVFLKLPPGHSLMLSFPHFHVMSMPGCFWSFLIMCENTSARKMLWRYCGNTQLPPELHSRVSEFIFAFFTFTEKGYTGFIMQFSFHSAVEVPPKVITNDVNAAVFNCSVPFYATFRQHLICNLETECACEEDEISCPYWQGDCNPGFLNAGGKCYKYVRTRKRMAWYDASSLCLIHGLTMASFPTFRQGQAFRDGLLRYAPTTFKTFIGLRTSDSSLPFIYREVWQWSTGTMAYYISIDEQQVFKPTCGSFAALYREQISTTMCGFYEYMHYIFCETERPETLNMSRKINLDPVGANSTFSLVTNRRFVRCPGGHITHDFLSCEHQSPFAAKVGRRSCLTSRSNELATKSLQILMYVCDSQTQTIHYTQVCDHLTQCFDSSDESFCVYRMCLEKQCLNRQCVTAAQWCDGMIHCSDGSDEVCPQFMTLSAKPSNASTVEFHVLLFDARGRFKYIPQGKEFPVCPHTHFMCSNRELCVPVYLRCNGVFDCSDQEDEDNCESARCPGLYQCRQSAVCVHSDHVCDGVFQCPEQDDELLCQLVCPDECLCQGLAFVCSQPFPDQEYPDLRYLDLSESQLNPHRVFHNHYLVRLLLSRCSLLTLPVFNLPNLKFLYLDNNILINVSMNAFSKLSNLEFLSLSGNPIIKLARHDSDVFLNTLVSLDLSFTKLKCFKSTMLWNVQNLKNLNLSHGTLEVISDTGLGPLTRVESLDFRGSKLKEYPVTMLQSLSYLRVLFSDVYKMCCSELLPKHFNTQNCHTVQDDIASCKDLLRTDTFKMFLWISCGFALFGNAGSFAAKLYMQRGATPTVFHIFISHLNVSDFVMGLYLLIVGSADQVYRGTYLWHDEEWKSSISCKTAGLFSLLSCEMSAFIISIITFDRLLALRFPFSQLRFNKTSAHLICVFTWLVSISFAVFPLLPVASHWEFYSQTDICIPLPITKKKFEGHFYSFGILIVFNFILFMLIAVGQLLIYISVRANSIESDQKNKRERTIAQRLLTVVMSDFLCWFPIGLSGLLASSGVSVPGDVNVAMAIFALPLNSALNPFIYTFNLIMEKRQKASEQRLLKILQTKIATQERKRQR